MHKELPKPKGPEEIPHSDHDLVLMLRNIVLNALRSISDGFVGFMFFVL